MFRSKKANLDTPFKVGERVRIIEPIGNIPAGTLANVRLSNGLGVYRRYWLRIGEQVVGQVHHNNLVRPHQFEAWQQREADREQQAEQAALAATTEQSSDENASSSNHGIPEALLERSRAAKQRLLG